MNNHSELEILYLGPELTFSHDAALLFVEKNRDNFGFSDSNIRLVPKKDQKAIEYSLSNNKDAFAVIPICNSLIGDVYRFLPFCKYDVVDIIDLPISFCICSNSPLEQVTEIQTIGVAFKQVRDELLKLIPLADEIFNPVESTAAAAKAAQLDQNVAAICSIAAAKKYHLKILKYNLEGSSPVETTFQVFRNSNNTYYSPPLEISSSFNYLLRGAAFYSGKQRNSGNALFSDLLLSRKKLNIKWGIDPLQKRLHLGHLSNILKVRDFLSEGHSASIVVGNFTGIIGDPSGNLSQRPHVNASKLDENARMIAKEIDIILNGYSYEIIFNDSLIKDFDLRMFLKWMRNIDVRSLLDRLDFQKRLKFNYKLSAAEFVYPLFQALDTAHIQPDIEIGGADQLWNALLIKDVMQYEGLKIPLILLVNELKGLDRADKMSSFAKNAVHLSDEKIVVEEKIMCMDDSLLEDYYISLTRCNLEEISMIKEMINSGGQQDILRIKTRLVNEINLFNSSHLFD